MADQRITQLTKLAQADVAANDVLAIVDVGSSITKKVEAKELFQAGANLADSASIDLAKLNQASATKLSTTALADDAVTGAKLADDSSIVYDSVAPAVDNFQGRGYVNSTSKYLQVWDGSAFHQVVAPTAGIENLAVTTGKLANNAVTTAKIDAAGLAAAALATDSVITAKIQDLAVTAAKITDATITTSKIAAGGLAESAIATNAITTGKILDDAVTAAKLANDSSTVVQAGTPVGSGAFEGQLWFDTNTAVKYVWNGAAWIRQAAINTITFSDTTPLNFAVAYPDNHSAVITTTLDTQVTNRALLGPLTGADAAPTFRDIEPEDLPDATTLTKGIVQPGTGLTVNAGVLNHTNSAVAGTFTKVTVDTQGHISAGSLLDAADIPSLSASKLTAGELPAERIADNAITAGKLADYATASIGEGLPAADFIGQLHLNPLDRAFFMWDGNVYVPIGISAGQILLAGTFDASTPAGVGSVQSVTPDGAAAGFVVGDPLPVSTLTNNKYYFVVSEGGTITSGNAPNVALAPPDLCLSVFSDTNPQWVEIDVSSGAGAIAATQVSFNPAASLASTNVQTALEEVSNECRDAGNITSGTLAVARGGTGLASYAKGNILAASATTTLNALPVGTNGQVLRANSATATGLEWSTPATGTVTSVTSSTGALTVATATTTPALTIRAATTSVNGIVQLSDSVSTTSSVLAATPTAVKSAYDLAAAALPKAGGTVTGDITLGVNIGIQFEGVTDDANEIRLIGADATADRTITLPNVTGTVITTGDSGTVTSAMIADGTIVNADINASAAIAGTKISPDFGSQNAVTTGTNTAASLIPTGSTVPTNGVYLPSANTVGVATIGVQRISIDANGLSSVGGPTGNARIELGQGATENRSAFIDFIGDTTYTDYGLRVIRGGTGENASSVIEHRGTGDLSFRATEAGPQTFYTSNTERLRITSAGLVGIGTSSPSDMLSVVKTDTSNSLFDSDAAITITNPNSDAFGRSTNLNFNQGADASSGRLASIAGVYTTFSTSVGGALAFSTNNGSGSVGERMRITSAGNVGIGTTSPATTLDVNGDVTITDKIIHGGDTNTAIRFPANDTVSVETNGSERARIDSDGRLLVGTSSAIAALIGYTPAFQVQSSTVESASASITSTSSNAFSGGLLIAKARGTSVVQNNDGLGQLRFGGYDGSAYVQAALIAAEVDGTPGANDMPGRLVFSTTADGASSPTERLRIDSSGNVGIGTSSPSTPLQVVGTVTATTFVGALTGTASGNLVSGGALGTPSSGTLTNCTFPTLNQSTTGNAATATTLQTARTIGGVSFNGSANINLPGVNTAGDQNTSGTASGNVRQGGGTGQGSNTVYIGWLGTQLGAQVDGTNFGATWPIGVSGNAATATDAINITNAGTIRMGSVYSYSASDQNRRISAESGLLYICNTTGDGGENPLSIQRANSTGNAMRFINGSSLVGTVVINAASTSYNTTSDYRLKENVVDLDGAIARLNQLPVHRFNFIADPDTVIDGFIAHEAAEVVPECVTGTKDEVDEDGDPVYQGIDQSKLVPLLTAALQEAIAEIELLKARLTAAGI